MNTEYWHQRFIAHDLPIWTMSSTCAFACEPSISKSHMNLASNGHIIKETRSFPFSRAPAAAKPGYAQTTPDL
jgi:hypothetical protein